MEEKVDVEVVMGEEVVTDVVEGVAVPVVSDKREKYHHMDNHNNTDTRNYNDNSLDMMVTRMFLLLW